jgi:predicted nucleic acid-binding protein
MERGRSRPSNCEARRPRIAPTFGFEGEAEASEWGRLTSKAHNSGLSVNVRDSLIAATAAVRGWTVATHNSDDFRSMGVSVSNPWTDHL